MRCHWSSASCIHNFVLPVAGIFLHVQLIQVEMSFFIFKYSYWKAFSPSLSGYLIIKEKSKSQYSLNNLKIWEH